MDAQKTQKSRVFTFLIGGFVFTGFVWILITFVFRGPVSGDVWHDFGVVLIDRPFSEFEHEFHLKNETNHALQLLKATPTCGCTTTQWPKDSVAPGDELVVPVHLKLRRSQLRKSEVRLEFATGELVVLHIKGIGRFKQPMSFTPPTIVLSANKEEGERGVLKLELQDEVTPKIPIVVVPQGIRVTFDTWSYSKVADSHKGTPNIWTLRVHTFLDTDATEEGELVFKMEGVPDLHIPFVLKATSK